MFTGTYPSKHGTHHSDENFFTNPLAPENLTIAEILREKGYRTAAVVANKAISRKKGFEQGFEVYFDGVSCFKRFFWGQVFAKYFPKIEYNRKLKMNRFLLSPIINETALTWIKNQKDQKFFMFINYMEAHTGYNYLPDGYEKKYNFNWADLELWDNIDFKSVVRKQKDISIEERKIIADWTDCKLTYLDHNLGKLFDKFKEMNLYNDSFIIITADHGDLWGEHNSIGHMADLYNELLNVPLIIKYPKELSKVGVKEKWVQLVDVMPEILYSLNIPIPEAVQGQPLDLVNHEFVAEVFKNRKTPDTKRNYKRYFRDLKAIYSSDKTFKYIHSSNGESELFNLSDDPYELNNLFGKTPGSSNKLVGKIIDWQNSFEPIRTHAAKMEIDTLILKQQLKSLGYIK